MRMYNVRLFLMNYQGTYKHHPYLRLWWQCNVLEGDLERVVERAKDARYDCESAWVVVGEL